MITKDSKKILIADDSVFFRKKLGDILAEAGHKVRFARSGKEAIDEISENSKDVDILTLDLEMPDIDGFGVLEWMSENDFKDRFPVIVVTSAYRPGNFIDRIRELGASDLLTKDFAPQQLVLSVNNLLFQKKAAEGIKRCRIPVSISVQFSIGKDMQIGFLLNLSKKGVFLHTRFGLSTGMKIRLEFTLPGFDKEFRLEGVVRWTTDANFINTLFSGGGIMFASISQDEQAILESFIESESRRLKQYDEKAKAVPEK